MNWGRLFAQNGQEGLSQDVVLLHNNTCPHTAHHTINTIQILNWEVLKHPAHSAGMVLSDFHLFEPIKNVLRGRQFVDDEVKRVMSGFINKQKRFFQRHQEAYRSLS